MAVSGWLVFAIVRDHSSWRPAAWIAAGAVPGADRHPPLLRRLPARLRAPGGAAHRAAGHAAPPPRGRRGRRRRARCSTRRPRCWRRGSCSSPRSGGLVAGRGSRRRGSGSRCWRWPARSPPSLGPALAAGGTPDVFTADEARQYPEFGADGALSFFVPSTIEYLEQNRSGFDLRGSGSILALAALALLVARPANLRLLRREVLAMPVVALVGFAAAHAVLFQLYLPHRYTYPLVAFFAIAVAVSLRPTWTALWSRPRPRLRAFLMLAAPLAVFGVAVYLFPLGPTKHLDEPWTAVAVAAGALVLAGAVALLLRRAPERSVPGDRGDRHRARARRRDARRHRRVGARHALRQHRRGRVLREPAEGRGDRGRPDGPAVHPRDRAPPGRHLDAAGSRLRGGVLPARRASGCSRRCAPTTARRRPRSPSSASATARPTCGCGPTPSGRSWPSGGGRWRHGDAPYGAFVSQLLRSGEPAVLHLPAACRRWRNESSEVYDIRCIADRARS